MREIKFRAWDKKKKQMVYHDTDVDYDSYDGGTYLKLNLDGSLGGYIHDDGGKSGLWEHSVDIKDRFELMQYTGLKDKNGREIYEGDIVKIIVYPNALQKFPPKICEVRYSDRHWGWIFYEHKLEQSHNPITLPSGEDLIIEVIGNIHQNPELIWT